MTAPSPIVLLSVAAVAVAGIAFVATQGDDDKEKVAVVSQPVVPPTAEPTPEKTTKPKKKKPAIKRGQIYVEVYNNSNISGLAGRTATKVTEAGWQVVGSDNWRGTIPATTVYYPPRLERAAKQLGKDLGIKRLMPAVEPMRFDRLTLILTPDYAS
ncbi:LytR C-terminal domain-containing protein [Nocardioides alcanivorans]|uniref:LytR C-terminal domain-containing protein n=1 Tax=Nocardioides alcanivorans TaxID=2897352 RepID=UPI001F2ECEFE|nr:LytR C-terminal domain-containing protein [Nocardioides alcanivorans]